MAFTNIHFIRKMLPLLKVVIPIFHLTMTAQAAVFPTVEQIENGRGGNDLISSVVNECLTRDIMKCINQKVLVYLDSFSSVPLENNRAFDGVEEQILSRVGRILAENKIKIEVPNSFFKGIALVYQPDVGLDLVVSKEEGRGILLKKKLFLPLLLLLKLKMKALMPILLVLIGLKATKALILSKIAIKIVLGFIIYQLLQKLGALKMTTTPMMPMTQMPPTDTASGTYGTYGTSASTNIESSWEPNTGPYARLWDSQKLAYSGYVPKHSIMSPSTSSLLV